MRQAPLILPEMYGILLIRWPCLFVSPFLCVNVASHGKGGYASPAIIDTDIGTFMDDTFALAFAMSLPELDIRLVVTASHDTIGRARVAAKHLSLSGADHIPIGIGLPTSNESGPLFGWAADVDLSTYPGGVHQDGVKAMQETIESCTTGIMTLIEIGPHTNVKSLIERFPGIEHRVRVVVMGGSVVPGIRLPWGHVTPVNTTNEKVDPIAARAMLHAQWSQPPQLAPIATTYQVVVKGGFWQEVRRSHQKAVQVILQCYDYWWQESRRNSSWITHGEAMSLDPSKQSPILFDVEAVHIAATARWLLFRKFTIDFSDYGHTQVLPSNSSTGSAAWLALNWTSDSAALSGESGINLFCKYIADMLMKASWRDNQFVRPLSSNSDETLSI